MNIKNAIILIVVFMLGAATSTTISVVVLNQQRPIIIQAVKKNSSEVNNDFGKIKTKKGGTTLVDLVNTAITNDTTKTEPVKEKKKWFGFLRKK